MQLENVLQALRVGSEARSERRRTRVPSEHAEEIEQFRSRLEAAVLQSRELAIEIAFFWLQQGQLERAGTALRNSGNAATLQAGLEQYVNRLGMFIQQPPEA